MNIRHGDLGLCQIKKLPQDLKETETKVLMTGSHGHDHFIDNGKVYLKKVDNFVFGYLVAKDTTLNHDEHKEVRLNNGIYELRKQNEWINDELKQIID